MNTNKHEEIKDFFTQFNTVYFKERDIQKTLSFLDKDIFAFGITETDIVHNFEEMKTMITKEIENNPSSYSYDFEYLKIFTIAKNLFLLICISNIKKECPDSNEPPTNFRASIIIKETEKGYKFSAIHVSVPIHASNIFLDLNKKIGNIHLNAQHTALDLLNSSVPGGMIGGYYKENFPLYFVNDQLLKKLGYKSQEEFIEDTGGLVINGIHPEDRDHVCKVVEASLKLKEEYEVEYRMKKSNGSYIWVLDRGRLVQTENGPVIVSICFDITEKVQLQQNIKTITDNIPGGVYKLKFDEDFTMIYGNDGFYKLYGYTPEEMKILLGNKLIAVTFPEDISKVKAILKNAFENKLKNFEFEKRITTKNGEVRSLLTKGVFVKEGDEYIINSIVIDISDRKAIEDKLKFNQAKLKLAMNSTKCIIFEYDLDSKTLTHLRIPPGNEIPGIIYNVPESRIKNNEIHPDHIETYRELYNSVLDGNPRSCGTIKTRLKNTKYKWTKIKLNNIIINGIPTRKVIGIVEDITEHQEFQFLNLFNSTLKKALLEDSMGYAYIDLSEDKVSNISGTWQKYLDKDLEYTYTYFFKKMLTLVHPEDKEKIKHAFSKENVIKNIAMGKLEESVEFRAIKENKEIIWCLINMKIINNPISGNREAIVYTKNIDIYKSLKCSYVPSIAQTNFKNDYIIDMEILRSEAKFNNLENILIDFKRTTENSPVNDDLFQYLTNILGKYYKAARVSIMKYDESLHQYICAFEYCQPGKSSNKKHWNDLKIRKGSDWEVLHKDKKIIKINDIEVLKNNDIVNYLNFVKLDIQSYFSVTIEAFHQDSLYLILDNLESPSVNIGFFELVSYVIESKIKDEILKNKFSFLDYHDMLTGLSNHKSFVEYKWNRSFHNYASLGLITSDINGLKQLNDKYGPLFGDEMIIKTAHIFKKYFPEEKLFRLSGDEFLVVCENIDNETFIRNIDNIKLEFSNFENRGLSIGYSWADDEIDFDVLHKNAEELMYIDKQKYYQNTNFTSKHYRPALLQKLLAEIKNNEYHVFLQPMIDLKTKKLSGTEALIRHINSDGVITPPIKFIPLLEKERLIRYIDFFVFEEVCKTLHRWKAEGKKLVPISLNFSRNTLLESDFVKTLKIIAAKYNVLRSLIEIEITETIGEIDTKIISNISKEIKNAGFTIALDDFGSKYSNISLFTTLEFDTLKLDRSLVEKLQVSSEKKIIVRSVINMCKEMNVRTIGEGIETEEVNSLLASLNCDHAQGYLYSRPIPIPEFEKKYF